MAGPNTKYRLLCGKYYPRKEYEVDGKMVSHVIIPVRQFEQIIRTSTYREKSKKLMATKNWTLQKKLKRCRERNRIAVVREEMAALQSSRVYDKQKLNDEIKEVNKLIKRIKNKLV